MNITNHTILNIGIAPLSYVSTCKYGQQIQLLPGKKWFQLKGAYLHGKVDLREKVTKGNRRIDVSISTKVLDSSPGLHDILRDEKFVCYIQYSEDYFKFMGTKSNPLSKTERYKGDYRSIFLKQSILFDSKLIYLPDFFVL